MGIGGLAIPDGFHNHGGYAFLRFESSGDQFAGHGPGAFGAVGVGGAHAAINGVAEAGEGIGHTFLATTEVFGDYRPFSRSLEGAGDERAQFVVTGRAGHGDVNQFVKAIDDAVATFFERAFGDASAGHETDLNAFGDLLG